MRKIRTAEISPGMILAKDVFSHENILFLAQGIELTTSHRETLISQGVEYVHICLAEPSQEESLRDNKINLQEKRFEKTYWEAIHRIESVIKQLIYQQRLVEAELRDAAQNLFPLISADSNVLYLLKKAKQQSDSIFTHLIGVGVFSMLLGKWLNYNESSLVEVGLAGIIHDIGKCYVPFQILNKQGSLSPEECRLLKKHTEYGFNLALESDIRSVAILSAILQHHERLDGSGYPFGLRGSQINEAARVVMVADIFEAMLANRSYRKGLTSLAVIEEIRLLTYGKLDPTITTAFLYRIIDSLIGCRVKLSNGAIGEIFYIDRHRPNQPMVKAGNQIYDLRTIHSLTIIEEFVDGDTPSIA